MQKPNKFTKKIILMKIKLNLHEYIVRLLAVLSMIVLIKTSDKELLFNNVLLNKIFIQFSSDNLLYQAIFAGIFVSYIFYIIVVKIPNDRKSKNIERVLSKKLMEVLLTLSGIFEDLIKQSKSDYKVEELDSSKINECIGIIDQNSVVEGVAKNRNLDQFLYREYIAQKWMMLMKQSDEVIKYNALLDGECVRCLHDIQKSKISTIIPYLLDLTTNIENFDQCGNLFNDLLEKSIELNIYYLSRFKNTIYKNGF